MFEPLYKPPEDADARKLHDQRAADLEVMKAALATPTADGIRDARIILKILAGEVLPFSRPVRKAEPAVPKPAQPRPQQQPLRPAATNDGAKLLGLVANPDAAVRELALLLDRGTVTVEALHDAIHREAVRKLSRFQDIRKAAPPTHLGDRLKRALR